MDKPKLHKIDGVVYIEHTSGEIKAIEFASEQETRALLERLIEESNRYC